MVFKQATYHISKIIFIFWAVFCLGGCDRKPPLPPPVSPPETKQTIRLNGKVTAYETNPEGNIDRMTLDQGKQKSEIHFPPHLARQILDIAQLNTFVKLKVDQRDRGYELISLASEDGKNTFDTRGIPPPKPSPGKEIRIKGTVSGWIRSRQNETTGFVIGRKTVMLNPEESRILAPLLIKAKQVEVTALERDANDGTINTLQFPPVKVKEITIDSIVYKIR
ncbi:MULTISPECIES: hypothetical protein [Chryseobacterium]|nr:MULTISPECIES: hypothetical protein [Chryseobacterium]